jgi:glycerophosphoryl diester phosphodiesterase
MKRAMTLMITLLLSFLMFGLAQLNSKVEAQSFPKTLTNTRNSLLADVGVPLDISMIRVSANIGEIFLNQATLTSNNPAVTFGTNQITVSQVGVFPITVSYDSKQMTIFIVSKLTESDEYVIYQEDFTGKSGAVENHGFSMLDGAGQPGGSAAIATNRLLLSGNTIVLFPSYLQSFTNYIIEVDVNMTQANDPSRWTSVLFRYTTENYFQMAVRQNAQAANGVEFAKRLSGAWNVTATQSFTESLSPASTYRFKIDVLDTTVKEYINDQLLITYDSAYEFTHGRIGVQTNGSNVYFDNIRITLPVSYVPEDRYEFQPVVNVYQPETGIVAPATSVVWVNSLTQITNISGTVRPATAILRVNDDFDIIDESGTVISTLMDALILIDGRVIPAFYVDDTELAALLAAHLKTLRIFDLFFVSRNPEVILSARSEHNLVRGLLYLDNLEQQELTKEDLIEIRKMTNRAQAVAVVLPVELINREKVHYMQQRLMTVWVIADDSIGSQYRAILSGANGIVTQDYESLFEIYKTFEPNTHVRRPLMIAHRGLYDGPFSSGPENTIEVALESYERGADIIEFDVHLTMDLEVIVIHDGTTIRTAPNFPSRTVSQSTLAQLRELNLADPVGGRENLKMPTLREFMLAFKDKDVVLFIEPKPTQPLLMQFIIEIIEELDMYDQSVIIAFSTANIQTMNTFMPEMANGLLTGGVLNISSVNASLTNTFSNVVTINSTLNPSFGGLSKEFATAIVHRGVTVWPWTLNEFSTLAAYYNYGVGGITTDYFKYFENTFNRIMFDQYHFEYVLGESEMFSIKGNIGTQSGITYPLLPEIIVIDEGGTGITFNQNGKMLTVNSEGTFYGFTKFSSNLPNGAQIRMVSDIFIIDVISPQIEEPTGLGTIAILLISLGSASLLGGSVFLGLRFRKLKKLR